MEAKDIIKDLWGLSQHFNQDGLEKINGYRLSRASSHPDNWIFQPGDPIRIGEREGIVSQLIASDMNKEARSQIAVIFDGSYEEELFSTNQPLTKNYCNSFFVFNNDKATQIVAAKRLEPLNDEWMIKKLNPLNIKTSKTILRKYKLSLVSRLEDWIEEVSLGEKSISFDDIGDTLPENLANVLLGVLETVITSYNEVKEKLSNLEH